MSNIPSLLRKHLEIHKKKSYSIENRINDNSFRLCKELGVPPPCKGDKNGASDGLNKEDVSYKQGGKEAMLLVNAGTPTVELSKFKNLSIILELSPPFRVSLAENLKIILQFENDMECGRVILHSSPMLTEAQQKIVDDFLNVILAEFNLYRAELKQRGVIIEDFTHELVDHKFTLRIPSPSYQDGFVHRLVEKQLLPLEILGAQIKRSHDYGWSLRPFITKLSSPKLVSELEEDESDELSSTSPLTL
jgi:hypothetical protein